MICSRQIGSARAIGMALAMTLAGCSSAGYSFKSMFESSDTGKPSGGPSPGLVAPLVGLGSAVSGKVRVIDRGDGITVMVSGTNLPIGEYRVAFHQNGNCSSPNGFSAGPAWAPPGRSPATLIPPLRNSDGNAEASVSVSGVHTAGENGLAGRSVLLYWGKIEEVRPGVRNNVIACGIFEPVKPFQF
jgi:Cu/Zn superoxide dismutase